MNLTRLIAYVCASFLFFGVSAQAQSKLRWSIRGTAYEVDASGKILAQPFTEKTLLKVLRYEGGTDLTDVHWAYHLQGGPVGDTISIIDPNNGSVLNVVFGLYFGEYAGRVALTNSAGTQQRRIDYIYTKQNDHSIGSAFVTKRTVSDRKGNNRVIIEGTMQWVVQPSAEGPAVICVGRFTTGKTLF